MIHTIIIDQCLLDDCNTIKTKYKRKQSVQNENQNPWYVCICCRQDVNFNISLIKIVFKHLFINKKVVFGLVYQ